MGDINIDQAEADALLALEKVAADSKSYTVLSPGARTSIPLLSADKRERFHMDTSRSALLLSKVKLQSRARTAVVLARLDLDGAPHQNPDGQIVQCPHLHLYREGYADKWAEAPPPEHFAHLHDLWETLQDFMAFTNVSEPPSIVRGIF